jgi:hypothetical protein
MNWHHFYVRYYRRYAGWLPVQFCMICGRPYWGGLPRFWIVRKRCHRTGRFYSTIGMTWQASWKDYCSMECCEIEGRLLDLTYPHLRK